MPEVAYATGTACGDMALHCDHRWSCDDRLSDCEVVLTLIDRDGTIRVKLGASERAVVA